ncbi:MAG: VTT domain-containing protein [Gemmataceae bacterium]
MDWLNGVPPNPPILVAIGVLWGLSGVPLTPYWAWLGFRCGWQQGFLLGWLAVVAALAIHFPLLRYLGNKLMGIGWYAEKARRYQTTLDRFQADAPGLVWARLAWALPFMAVNLWAARGNLGYWRFLALSAAALVPNIAGVALSGDLVAQWNQPGGNSRHFAMALGLLGLAGLAGWAFRRFRQTRS